MLGKFGEKKKIDMKVLQRPILLVTVIVIMTVLRPTMFLKSTNIQSILLSISIYGIIACGTMFPLLIGGIDLSIGSICALSGCTTLILVMKFNYTVGGTIAAFVIGILVGVLCGVINGVITVKFAIPAFVVTLATKNIVYGLAQMVTNKNTITCLNSSFVTWLGTGHILGIPMPIVVFLICVIITAVVLEKTVFGRRIYAVGGNPKASTFTGIKSSRIQILAYIISGFMAGLGGIMLSCFNSQGIASQGSSYDGDVLVALVVGGVSMSGGEGSIVGGVFGLVLMGIVKNALTLLSVDSCYQDIVTGVVVVLAVAIDMYGRTKDDGLQRKRRFSFKKQNA